MKETEGELRRAVMIWCFLFTAVALLTATRTALAHVEWQTLTTQGKFETCSDIFVIWGTVMMAFINKAVTNAKAGKSIINGDSKPPFPLEDGSNVKPKP